MNVVDSSGWLAYFADEPSAIHFEPPLRDLETLIVPTISIYEVSKVVLRERGETEALTVVAMMMKGQVVELSVKLALAASQVSVQHTLPMADSIILATARAYGATVWTQDVDFLNYPGVRYFPK